MTGALRRAGTGLLCAAALLLASCAAPPRTPTAAGVQAWSGRLALNVEGQASQSFSAGFELKGAPAAGQLTLTNPLGGTLARLEWSPGHALLRADGREREFPSLADLAQQATGAPLPVAALFDWLAGKPTPVDGWQPDLAQVANGRLRAHRYEPLPQAELRVVFEH